MPASRKAVLRLPDGRLLSSITETGELTDALKVRLRLGAWTAMHVRLQGNRRLEGIVKALHPGGRPRTGLGVLEVVPPRLGFGWLDWTCLHPGEMGPLIIELKSEAGIVNPEQAEWLNLWRQVGAEIAVVRPRDVFLGTSDALSIRLIEHRKCPSLCTKGSLCTGWCRAEGEALEAAALVSARH